MDMSTGCLRCTYCQCELVEETSQQSSIAGGGTVNAAADPRSLMARFNDQIEPIYQLLRKVEDIRLSADILEPEPTDFKPTRLVAYRTVPRQF